MGQDSISRADILLDKIHLTCSECGKQHSMLHYLNSGSIESYQIGHEVISHRICEKCLPKTINILDVGSGYAPHPQATLLCDAYIGETIHRGVERLIIDERPFILCSAEYLPFKPKSIDVLYCSAVLEHVDDPMLAKEEINRVSKKSVVNVPRSIWEALFDVRYEGHQWICNKDGTFSPFDEKIIVVCLQRLMSFFWKRNFRIKFRERFTRKLSLRLGLLFHTFITKTKEES